MNTYFSSSIVNRCGKDCSYLSCPEKYLSTLRAIPAFSNITALPGNALFQPEMTSPLRSGDLLILHAESDKDLKKIVSNRRVLEQFRLILIIGERAFRKNRTYHLLNPRFIMTSKQNTKDLQEVVEKITGQTTRTVTDINPVDSNLSQPDAR